MRKDHLLISLTSVAFLMMATSCSNTGESNEKSEEQQSERVAERSTDTESVSTKGGADSEERQDEGDQTEPGKNNRNNNEFEGATDEQEYVKSLAITNESNEVHPKAVENLELPGIHENTLIYNGTVSPGQTASFVFPYNNNEYDYSNSLDAKVSDEGHFSVSFSEFDLDEMDEIRFIVTGNIPQEQAFDLPIHPAEDGMEYIQSEANTEGIEESIRQNVQLDDIYENTRFYHVQNVLDDVDAVHFEHPSLGFSNDINRPAADVELENKISTSFNETDIEGGDVMFFYIIANGVTTVVEKEVQTWSEEEWAQIDAIKEETKLDDIYSDEVVLSGTTVPNATITINNLNPRNFNVEIEADENGDFKFEFNESRDTIESESILYSIVDEEGHLATLEKPIQ